MEKGSSLLPVQSIFNFSVCSPNRTGNSIVPPSPIRPTTSPSTTTLYERNLSRQAPSWRLMRIVAASLMRSVYSAGRPVDAGRRTESEIDPMMSISPCEGVAMASESPVWGGGTGQPRLHRTNHTIDPRRIENPTKAQTTQPGLMWWSWQYEAAKSGPTTRAVTVTFHSRRGRPSNGSGPSSMTTSQSGGEGAGRLVESGRRI
jgi:hypothetical protein